MDLLDQGVNDPDWESFQNNDPAWNLKVAGEAVRLYCGWHIYPNRQLTVNNLTIGSKGIITLPSMHVTDVASVMVQATEGNRPQIMDPSQYNWYAYGTIEPIGFSNASSGYGPGNWAYSPTYNYTGLATVTFNSGYDALPTVVKSVAYELATTNIEVSAGNVKEIQTPGFRLQLMQAYGANLNPDQKNRLGRYRLPTVI